MSTPTNFKVHHGMTLPRDPTAAMEAATKQYVDTKVGAATPEGIGAARSGANSDITSLAGLTTDITIAQGGTGASDAPTALSNLGALPKAGGAMTGQLALAPSTLTVPSVLLPNSTETTSSPVPNAMEWNGTAMYITSAAGTRRSVAFLDSNITGSAASAAILTTARNISVSGDATGSASFNGSANAAIALTLANTVTAGTSTKVTYDSKGRVTAGSALVAADIPSLDFSKIGSGLPTTLSGYGITDAVNVTMKGTANGVASLDANGKVVASQLPALAITDTFVVANQAAMLALTAETGDIAVRTDLAKTFILRGPSSSTLADWQELLNPVSPVQSVNGMTGAVTVSTITGNAGTATALQTARNITLSGDASASATFDGTANTSLSVVLANSGVTAGTYPKVTVDAKGRVTAGAALVAADIPSLDYSKITSGKPTTLAGYGITDSLVKPDGTVAMTGSFSVAAGTATVAPIKFQAGVALTTPVAHALEWNGTNMFVTNSSAVRKTIAYTDSSISGTAANVTGTVAVANGGTGATSLTGYVKGSGTGAMTASSTIPGSDVSGNISGSAANVTGTVAVSNGGTGAATAAAALVNLGAPKRALFGQAPENSVAAVDLRLAPNPMTQLGYGSGVRFRFAAQNDVDTTQAYADVIDLSTYTDGTGGGVNSLYFNKSLQYITHKFAAAGATTWTSKQLAYTTDLPTKTSQLTNDSSFVRSNSTSTADLLGLFSVDKSLTLTTAWQDAGINAGQLAAGSYMVQVYANDSAVGGGHYETYYTGVMSWFNGNTNADTSDEIVLHRAGHASNGASQIFLRVQRTFSADVNDLKLQIAAGTNNSGASTYSFKFRRMI